MEERVLEGWDGLAGREQGDRGGTGDRRWSRQRYSPGDRYLSGERSRPGATPKMAADYISESAGTITSPVQVPDGEVAPGPSLGWFRLAGLVSAAASIGQR